MACVICGLPVNDEEKIEYAGKTCHKYCICNPEEVRMDNLKMYGAL